jgi:hypothetical protein
MKGKSLPAHGEKLFEGSAVEVDIEKCHKLALLLKSVWLAFTGDQLSALFQDSELGNRLRFTFVARDRNDTVGEFMKSLFCRPYGTLGFRCIRSQR